MRKFRQKKILGIWIFVKILETSSDGKGNLDENQHQAMERPEIYLDG